MASRYWEDRGAGFFRSEVSADRAARCFAEAQADPNSDLQGNLEVGFTYAAGHHDSCGAMVKVIILPLADGAPALPGGG